MTPVQHVDDSVGSVRSHFGSRAISVQVNILAVPAHAFRRFFVGFLFLVSTLFCSNLMSQPRVVDASGTPVPDSPMQFSSSNVGSPHGSGHDLDGMGTCFGNTLDEKFDALVSKFVPFETSLKLVLSRDGCPAWIHISRKHLGILRLDLQRWNRNSVLSLIARMCKFETCTASASNVFEQVDGSTAAGSHCPGSSDDSRNTRRRIDISQTLMMSMREVPSYSDSLVNNISKTLHIGSIPFGMNLVCWYVTKLLEFIAKGAPCQSDLCSKHEETFKTLLSIVRMMAFLLQCQNDNHSASIQC